MGKNVYGILGSNYFVAQIVENKEILPITNLLLFISKRNLDFFLYDLKALIIYWVFTSWYYNFEWCFNN